MSEKWETVGNGKAKPAANGKAKVNGTKNPKKEQKVYTMEEVLPNTELKNKITQWISQKKTERQKKESEMT